MSLSMMFLGSGSAFTQKENNYHSNVLLTLNKNTLLLDAGTDLRFSLADQNKDHHAVHNVYITHLHADHVGGLEWLALSTYFDTACTHRIGLFLGEPLVDDLWQKTLSGGLSTLLTEQAKLSTYFNVHPVRPGGHFIWQGITFTLVQMVHVFNHYKVQPCFGLWFNYKGTKVFYSGDTQTVLPQLAYLYDEADIIFHDCETSRIKSSVHTHYEDLKLLPPEVRAKMWLYHYNPVPLPDAKAAGFAGFVQRGQCFHF